MLGFKYRRIWMTSTVVMVAAITTACGNPFQSKVKSDPNIATEASTQMAAETKAGTKTKISPEKAKSNTPAKANQKADAKSPAKAGKNNQAKGNQAKNTPAKFTGKPDPSFQQALDRADSARSISQSAANTDDWKLAASRWEQAIDYIKQVPKADPNQKLVGAKLAEFQRGLEIAELKSQGLKVKGRLEPAVFAEKRRDPDEEGIESADSSRTFRAPIKYRSARIPVIDVTFNNGQVFEMMVDTGASGTMISYDMANTLGLRELGKVTVGTAAGNADVSVAEVKAISVSGKTIYNVPVTVGPAALLGHDFFGDCDVTIRRDVVEFVDCSV
jgi:predicted aspartyl protease